MFYFINILFFHSYFPRKTLISKDISIYFQKNLKKKIIFQKNQKKNDLMMKDSINQDIITWELDFFSRPVINEDGKKLWELIVVDQNGTFEHVESIPNNLVNSKELRKRIQIILEKTSHKPRVIKFFRTQMFNMINIALSDFDIIIRPSRRTFRLLEKINEREQNIYPKMFGYRPFMRELDTTDFLKKAPEKMPDSLRGEKYIFASLSYSELIKVSSCKNSFCDLCPLPSKFDIKQNIPGIVIFSERAKSLSSWLNSIELYNIYCDFENRDIIIECGLDTKYLFSKFSDDTDFENLQFEPKIFEKNKKKSNGIHFIAVQEKFNQKEIFGFWTMKS
jgi:hypothetical protein